MPDLRPTRRSFLQTSAGAVAALPLVGHLQPRRREPKKILVLGGTGFLGPHFVRAAVAAGHTVTLFNRGRTNPGLFKELEQLHGQRRRPRPGRANDPAQDLSALENRKWDCVLDTSGYFTGEVEDVCKVLGGNVGQYVYVSSMSVYASLEKDASPVDEDSPLLSLQDKYVQDMGKEFENYGGLKRHCEDAAAAAFPGAATLVRPGYIVGPGDYSDRFSYWPARFDRGGECLAPGDPDNDLQFIDVRDLGAWLVHLCEQKITGPFNAVGFDGRISVEEFLHTGKGTRNHSCTFTWVDDKFLEDNGVSSWQEMGCWTPKAKNGHTSNAKAIAAGAKYRPIAETIRDTAEWVKNERGDGPWRAGMTAEREKDLLAKWKAR
ncbi:MAG: twin-arginine translocation signal domain-containing protein [Planctomycetes bacterium]|nr:twin-arginine translocation signal domain-containing protein [Planctomycetota bacterium]